MYLSVGSGISDPAKAPLLRFPSYPQQLVTTNLPYSYEFNANPSLDKFIVEVTAVKD